MTCNVLGVKPGTWSNSKGRRCEQSCFTRLTAARHCSVLGRAAKLHDLVTLGNLCVDVIRPIPQVLKMACLSQVPGRTVLHLLRALRERATCMRLLMPSVNWAQNKAPSNNLRHGLLLHMLPCVGSLGPSPDG